MDPLVVWAAIAVLLLLPALAAASGPPQAAGEQLDSVRRQAAAAGGAARSGRFLEAKGSAGGFFVTPWPWRWFGSGETPDGRPACVTIPRKQLDALIEEAAKKEGFTPDLLRAVISRESAFDPCAVSAKGAQGLMQLMPETAAALGVTDAFDPAQNVQGGARYLGELLQRYDGDVALALAAYNAGPGRVARYDGLPPIPETIDYVRDILKDLEKPID